MHPLQRVVDPLGREQRERLGLAGRRPEGAVRDRVVDEAHVGQREGGFERGDPVVANVLGGILDHEGQRHAAIADADDHRHLVMLDQQPDLAPVVFAEQRRPGHRRAVDAGIVQGAERAPGIEVELAAIERDADERIERLDQAWPLGLGARLEARERLGDDRDAAIVDLRDPLDRRFGVLVGMRITHALRCEGVAARIVHRLFGLEHERHCSTSGLQQSLKRDLKQAGTDRQDRPAPPPSLTPRGSAQRTRPAPLVRRGYRRRHRRCCCRRLRHHRHRRRHRRRGSRRGRRG